MLKLKEIRLALSAEWKRKTGKKLTQARLAEMVGVSEATISRYESGEIWPSDEHMEKLAQVLGIEPHVLLEGFKQAPPGSAEARRILDSLNEEESVRAAELLKLAFGKS